MSRIGVRHCSKLYSLKLKNVQIARKGIIFFFVEAQPIEL